MPKNLFQDMVMVKKTTKETSRKKFSNNVKISKNKYNQEPFLVEENSKPRLKYGLWLVAFISIIFFIFAVSFVFSKAQVTLYPKTKDITLDKTFSAIKDSNTTELPFDLVIISGEENRKFMTTEEQDLFMNSKGIVFIYNIFSSSSQNLAINTRLEGSNGKIYKITKNTIVPGMKEDGTPGKVEVGIYGNEAGIEYDSAPLDFKIISFKGTSKDSKFYARSIGSITGGYKGKSGVISDIEKENIFKELSGALKEKLFKQAYDQIPNGFILFKDATYLNIDEESVEYTSIDKSLPIKIKGTLYGFLFNENKLTQKIVKDNLAGVDITENEVYISNIRDFIFSMPVIDTDISQRDIQNIDFSLKGVAKVVWKIDNQKFLEDIIGKSKDDFNRIMSGYSSIDSGQLSLSPFWVTSLPNKLENIEVLVHYP